MINLAKETAALAHWSTAERLRALKRIVPKKTLLHILNSTGHNAVFCAKLPAWIMVWFVIGLGLFARDSYRQIYKWLFRFAPKNTPNRSTFCEARQRMGLEVFRLLYQRIVRLLATPATPQAFYRGQRLMALDGFVLDVPDSPDNARLFGRPHSGRAAGAFPQVRVLGLCEVGTHVLWRWLLKPIARGEISMAPYLLRLLTPGMLLLWDRNFFSFQTVVSVIQSAAHLLARVKTNLILEPIRTLTDGSYLAKIYPSATARKKDADGVVVRVIDYTFDDPGRPGHGQRHRLLTTLLDEELDPAVALIVLYHERWEEELTIDDLKTHQQERPVLRSETPAGVVQEVYGLLLAHFVVRTLMFEAATGQGYAPRQLSFTGTLKILRCRLPECPKSARGLQKWWQALVTEIAEETLEPRRDRVNPRVIKRKMSKWPKKRPHHRQTPQPTKKIRPGIKMLR